MMFVRLFAVVLVVIGVAAALATGLALVSPASIQSLYGYALPEIESIARPDTPTTTVKRAIGPGDPIGVIEIPRLGLSSVVLESDDTEALLFGVGHLADTPLPWRGGNSVFAAHRDTFFRGLGDIKRNDVIRFRAGDRELSYRVRQTKIVKPTDVEVLAPTKSATLTLITCYPFHYVGPAPKRFIVRAERVAES
ncbi:MAG TPA: class D sortase [Vicinamibacterales bacterium]|jgi:sortase A|nr:class D sortase [Vicinamibacterales bacterium]